LRYSAFDEILGEPENAALRAPEALSTDVLRNFNAKRYGSVIEERLGAYKFMGCKISLIIRFRANGTPPC
jgi:hypothetical protein